MEQRNADYKTKDWKEVREAVFKHYNYECVRCNHRLFDSGRPKTLTKPTLVHHIYELSKYPQYKYQMFVEVNGKEYPNLVPLCFECHEEIHGRRKVAKEEFMNEERFD